jgi:hypothetical protein
VARNHLATLVAPGGWGAQALPIRGSRPCAAGSRTADATYLIRITPSSGCGVTHVVSESLVRARRP